MQVKAFTKHETRNANHGLSSRNTAFTALRFSVGAQEMQDKTENRRKGPPRPPTSHCLPVWNFPLFPGNTHYFPVKKYASEPVSTHRPPFSVGFTTSAVSWEFPGLCGEPGVHGRPSGPPRPPPSRRSPVHDCSLLFTIVRYCSPLFGKKLMLSQGPRLVLRSRWASRLTPMNPC